MKNTTVTLGKKAGKPAKPVKKAKKKPMSARAYKAYIHYLNTHPVKKTKTTTQIKIRTLSLRGSGEPVKFGRKPQYSEAEKPRLVLDHYLDFGTLPTPPAVVDRASKVTSWPMYSNDTIGDCTCATVGHEIEAWTAYADNGQVVSIPDSSVISLYSAVSGYDPSTGANDNGAAIQDVLSYWQSHGVADDPGKVLAFAQLKKLDDLTSVAQVLDLFGTVYIGLNVPDSAMTQFDAGQPWTVVAGSAIDGGHAVPVQYIDGSATPVSVVTWAKLQPMSWGFWTQYVEEAWVVITQDWLEKNGATVTGLDLYSLGQDFKDLTGSANPFPAPTPPAPPAPVPAPPGPTPSPTPAPVPPAPAPQPEPSWIVRLFEWLTGWMARG